MAAQKQRKPINLLPQGEFESTTLGIIMHWITTSFRVIVILTEMVVLAAFLSRFWFDAKNSDLIDLIKQKQAVIASSSDFEKEFKLTQKRLEVFSQAGQNSGGASSNLMTISSLIPVSVTLTSYSYTPKLVMITGEALGELGVAQFIFGLNKSKLFEKVSLNGLKSDPKIESLYTFTINMIPKGK